MLHGMRVLFPSQDSTLRLSLTSSHHLKTVAQVRIGLQHILKIQTHSAQLNQTLLEKMEDQWFISLVNFQGNFNSEGEFGA